MPDSASDHLGSEMECESLLKCFFGPTDLDREVYGVLADGDGPTTVDQVAAAVELAVDRVPLGPAARRRGIRPEGVGQRRQRGYYHVFEPADSEEATDRLQRMLNDWYAKTGQLIGEFRGKYGEAPADGPWDRSDLSLARRRAPSRRSGWGPGRD